MIVISNAGRRILKIITISVSLQKKNVLYRIWVVLNILGTHVLNRQYQKIRPLKDMNKNLLTELDLDKEQYGQY